VTITDDDLDLWERFSCASADLVARDAVPRLCAEVRDQRSEIVNLNTEVTRLEEQRDALRAENERLQSSASAADHVIGTLRGDLARMKEGNRDLRDQWHASKAEASELRACLADAVGKIEVMRALLTEAHQDTNACLTIGLLERIEDALSVKP